MNGKTLRKGKDKLHFLNLLEISFQIDQKNCR